MKVLCITDKWEIMDVDTMRKPVFGEVCKVCDHQQDYSDQLWYYELAGFEGWFEEKAFIPLSTIDETEMIRNYETARI